MRKSVLIVLFLIIGFVSASSKITVNNYSLDNNYYANQSLSGELNLTVKNIPSNTLLRTNLNQSYEIKNILDYQGIEYNCSNFQCPGKYTQVNPGSQVSLPISSDKQAVFGFPLRGQNVEIAAISFTASSNFGEQNNVPLTLNFFNSSSWSFDKISSNFNRFSSFGCYNLPPILTYDSRFIENIKYCEQISIPESSKIQLGAKIKGTGPATFTMSLLDSLGTVDNCNFDSSSDSCNITSDDKFSEGDYYVCISSNASSYSISSEENSENLCGWAIDASEAPDKENSTRNYGIFVRLPSFAAATPIQFSSSSIQDFKENANNFLKDKYNNNCSNWCYLPVYVSGVNQILVINNVNIDYLDQKRAPPQSHTVAELELSPSNLDFNGTIHLNETGLTVGDEGNKTLKIYLGDTLLVQKQVNVLSGISIKSIVPQIFATGADVNFTMIVDSDSPIVSYRWSWGDNTSDSQTIYPSVMHRYEAQDVYNFVGTITDANGFTASKPFSIYAGSPKDLINKTLTLRKNSLSNATSNLNIFPSWYRPAIDAKANISYFEDMFKSIESKKSLAASDSDFLALFTTIRDLNPPSLILPSDVASSPLVTDMEKINPAIVKNYLASNEENTDDYKPAISSWQSQNIQGNINRQKITATYSNGDNLPLITVYSATITSLSDEDSYIVVDYPIDSLHFNSDVDERKSGESTVLELAAGETKSFEFYVDGDQDITMFVSPKLSSLPLSTSIGACNFNGICEKDLNEDYKNCRSDCFPVGQTIIWMIALALFAITAYSLLAFWYKTRYEAFLFKDKNTLYNILMFISNARASGMSDLMISEQLKKQGWNNEQIKYAVRKSRGQRTGMPELIPFDKISAYFRDKQAKQNINKAPIQGINRW